MTASEDTPLIDETGAKAKKKQDRFDKPFTVEERIAYPLSLALLPWVGYVPLMYLFGLIRVYPERPWFTGLWLAPLILTISYLIVWTTMLGHPRIVRDAVDRTWSDVEQKHPEETQKEKVARWLQILFLLGYCCVSSYDAAGTTREFPVALRVIGSILVVVSFSLSAWVVHLNKYISTVLLAKAPDRALDQKLVRSGPYSYVRHPIYFDWIIYSLGMPLVIGSYWGLIPSSLTLPLCMWRTFHEEDSLVRQYGEEYEDYRKEVTSKIIPGVF